MRRYRRLWARLEAMQRNDEFIVVHRRARLAQLPIALDTDGALFRAFGVRQMPVVALLDPDGRVVRLFGPNDRDLAAAVRELARK